MAAVLDSATAAERMLEQLVCPPPLKQRHFPLICDAGAYDGLQPLSMRIVHDGARCALRALRVLRLSREERRGRWWFSLAGFSLTAWLGRALV